MERYCPTLFSKKGAIPSTGSVLYAGNEGCMITLLCERRGDEGTGFAEVDITPPVGTRKIGWMKVIVSEAVLDPLFARIAVMESGGVGVGFVQLDTLSIRWTTTQEIRRRISEKFGFNGSNIMLSARHNHAGPAVANCGDVKRDEKYIRSLIGEVVEGFSKALDRTEEAEYGFGHISEFRISHNRRVIMRDRMVKTHGSFSDPNALCFDGGIDPEVAVLALRNRRGKLLGTIVSFACHPTDHGGDGYLSAGYPGVLASRMKQRDSPVTLFLTGACGNISTADPTGLSSRRTMEKVGRILETMSRRFSRGSSIGGALGSLVVPRLPSLPSGK